VDRPDDAPLISTEVLPPATYEYSTGGGPELGSLAIVDDIVRFAGAKERAAVPKLPDHLAAVIRSRPALQFVGTALFANTRQLERLQNWAGFVTTNFCLRGHPQSLAAFEAIYKLAGVLREIPPVVMSALPRLLCTSSPLRHHATRLLQWLPPAAIVGREAEVLDHLLGSVLVGDERDSHFAVCAIARLITRLSAGVRDERLAVFSCVAFRFDLQPTAFSTIARSVQAIAQFAWENVAGLITSESRTPMREDAVLCLLEAASTCEVPVPFPESLLRTLFREARNCMSLSRTLGVVVSFSSQAQPDSVLTKLVDELRTELSNEKGSLSLVSHPALRSITSQYIAKVVDELSSSSSSSQQIVTPTEVLASHKTDLANFLQKRGLIGVDEFIKKWMSD
jgi:hypothetical protein